MRGDSGGGFIVSLNLSSNIATVTFDDGRVLTVDRNTGAFSLVDDAGQDVITGTASASRVGDELLNVSAAYELAEDPETPHVFAGAVVADTSTDGLVNAAGVLDGDPVDETVDLSELSYRPDASTVSPDRAPSAAPGVLSGDDDGLRWRPIGWLVFLVVAAIITAALVWTLAPALSKQGASHQKPIDNAVQARRA